MKKYVFVFKKNFQNFKQKFYIFIHCNGQVTKLVPGGYLGVNIRIGIFVWNLETCMKF